MSGAVYLLANMAMPTFFKVGKCDGEPFERAAQLSAPSGVPHPFEVLCYIRTAEPLAEERSLHDFLADFRHSFSREFFRFVPDQMPWLVGLFKHHPRAEDFWIAEGYRRTRWLKQEVIENPWASINEDGDPEMTSISPDAVYLMRFFD